jgi:peptide/nickel transport system substrate-binding protein
VRVHTGKALLAGVSAIALALTACGSSGGGGGKGGGGGGSGTMKFGEATDFPENLLPLISAGNATSTANLEIRMLDGAFIAKPNLTYAADPDQITSATSTVQNGQQVVDIKINPKAVWADGKPITADDYIFSWQAQKSNDPKKGGCAALLSEVGFDQIESAKAVSDKEVQFTFMKGKSYADWKGLFAGPSGIILSKHIFDKGSAKADCDYITKGWPTAQGIPLGAQNGPWILEQKNISVADKTFILTPNPKYWGAKPKLARLIDVNIGSDSDTNVKAVQNGEVDAIYPQPQLDLLGNLKKLPNVTSQVSFGASFEHLDFNTADPLLKHKEIRQAIAYAIDRKGLVAATVGKFSDKAGVLDNRLLVANQAGYQAHGQQYDTQNIAKAKQLLESIGCTKGPDGIYRLGGKKLSFTVITTQQNPLRDQTIATIAAQVKQAGIQLKEFADPDIFAGPDKPNSLVAEGFQIALFAWVGTPSISSNVPIYLSPAGGGKGQNYTQGGTPEIDQTLQQLSTATSAQAEIDAANKADSLLWDQMYTLPLYQKPTLLAYNNKVKGISDNTTSAGPLWQADKISVG